MNTTTHHEHEEEITAAGSHYRCLFRREVDGGYRVTCAELPPLLAFGETLDEARANAREEIEAWLDQDDGRAPIERRREWWAYPA